MTDQNSPQPPSNGGPGDEQTSGSGFPPPGGSGSIYESSAYHQPPPETPQEPPQEPPAQPMSGSAAVPPPVAGATPPGYEGYPPQAAYPQSGAYAAPPAKNNTQLFGILGIVFAVVCCPLLGILFGWLSMNEAKKTGSDDTLGKVGFWLGIAFTAIAVVSVIIAGCAGAFGAWDNNY